MQIDEIDETSLGVDVDNRTGQKAPAVSLYNSPDRSTSEML
jgi:hypothetical protein